MTDVAEFDYELPEAQIAQEPLPGRSTSRLMVVDRATGALTETRFDRIVEWLRPGDVLVRNDTRVVPARVHGTRIPDGAGFEATFFEQLSPTVWRALCKPGKKLKHGTRVRIGALEALVLPIPPGALERALPGERWLAFEAGADLTAEMRAHGEMPLPPYVKTFHGDPERYQTTYAKRDGAIAAPTAGFHFTPETFAAAQAHGVEIVDVTLHVGPGTFQPVRSADYTQHRMLPERFEITAEASAAVARARAEGRRVIAIGSTSLRVLETLAADGRLGQAAEGATDLYCYPGYRFQVVGAMVTNLHLPRTTLLLLVMAFGGVELMRRAYARAVSSGFRFYSFGDAMFIV